MPAAWDRLADATQKPASLPLSIVALGDVHAEDLMPLTTRFVKVEQLVLDIPPRDPLSSHRGEFNRALDAASSDWVLIVRERETVDDALADEIAEAASQARARGYRIRSVPLYAGRPLRIGRDASEVRLFHRRYYLRFANKGEWDEVSVQGTVVRLRNVLHSVTFASAQQHFEELARRGVRRPFTGRVLFFLRDVVATGARDRNTLRYIWTEAAFTRE